MIYYDKPTTVAELITALQAFPPALPVIFYGDGAWCDPLPPIILRRGPDLAVAAGKRDWRLAMTPCLPFDEAVAL